MKPVLFILSLLICFTLSAQISVSKVENFEEVGRTPGKWTILERSGDTYRIVYRDPSYTTLAKYESIQFEDIDDAVNNLYELIISSLSDPPDDDIKIEFPNDVIFLNFSKQVGVPVVRFVHYVNKSEVSVASQYYTRKYIDKLFGKR